MRRIAEILMIVVCMAVFVWGVPYLMLHFSGKTLLIQQLRIHTDRDVSIEDLSIRFPLHVRLDNLVIKDLISIERVDLAPDFIALFAGKLVFANVRMVRPEMYHTRGRPRDYIDITPPERGEIVNREKPETAAGVHLADQTRMKFPVIFRHIGIQDGVLHFTDYKADEDGLRITLRDISMGIDNLYTYPYSAITTFGVKANIPWEDRRKQGRLFAEGWINFFKKDIQATMNIDNIDGIYLEPYYNERVDFERAGIEDATLRFKSLVQGLNNDVHVKSEFELIDIVRSERAEEEFRDPAERLTDTLLVLFKSLDREGRVKLPLEYTTKLDRPEFGFGLFEVAFRDTVTEARIQRSVKPEKVLGFPGKIMEGVFKGVADVSKAVIVGSVTVASELGQGVAASFRRDQPVHVD